MWLEDFDEGPALRAFQAHRPATSADADEAGTVDARRRPSRTLLSTCRRRVPGFLLRPQAARTALQMATDKWLRRLGVATFAVLAVGGALLGAPTMLDLANASREGVDRKSSAAPEPLDPPSGSAADGGSANRHVPATPDISADVTLEPGGPPTPAATPSSTH